MKDCHLSNEVRVKMIPFHTLQHETEKMIKDAILEWSAEAMIFATNALSLSGLYSIQDIGIKVPEELAIVGFTGNEAFDSFYSPLTYVKQPVYEMGKEAVRVLIDQIKVSKKVSKISLPPPIGFEKLLLVFLGISLIVY
ncbi:MAG TPA: substrate-binding domain-containing protein [Bacteroidales bacterium]|nr:substrate-binding domain-containing protein [Bacteroidales bacterium]HQK70122.1 substrate-binding domain-containing protein [Bacteroidales bacterium]